ncbi:MAG TPA: hypothetical protein VL360_08855 [Gammaproteobacteria bacterium]|jgi:hypothetical protein|nr:hypothetical protein [Gammaproteobacteria bacterium]
MNKKNICPACKKYHPKMPAICMCGEHLTKEETGGCPFIKKDGSVCGKPASRSYQTKAGGWYCSKCAEDLQYQNYRR